jgi:Zn-dependent protease with chaperone function
MTEHVWARARIPSSWTCRVANGAGIRSIAWRAALAVSLMIGFYGLALTMLFGLVALPILAWSYVKGLTVKVGIFCGVGAFLILRSILPRRDRFEAPGPMLGPGRHPRLFAELRQIAAAAAQPMPVEVYLVADVNAWVAHRGGVMGVGAHEVMGLGLPLLHALRVSELRAVLAHEFGHYVSGDVKLGPWVYKTRQALLRTVEALAGHSGLLARPFLWYATLFFRVSHAVSRHQELQADALAARVAGPAAVAGGLRGIHRATLGYRAYWLELMPVLGAGFLPPVVGGFARFMEQPGVVSRLHDALDQELREGKQDPYDTHPCLRDRLAALPPAAAGAEDGAGTASDPSAITLLDELPELERQLVVHIAGENAPARFDPVQWDDVPAAVHIPGWRAFLAAHGRGLEGVRTAALASLDWDAVGRRLARSVGDGSEPERVAEYAIGCALCVALAERGFAVEPGPGVPPALARGRLRLEPFALRASLAEAGSAERWRAFCAETGLEDIDLGGVVPR